MKSKLFVRRYCVPKSFSKSFHVKDLKELKKLADKISPNLEKGDLFLLEGEMGSGKSEFVRHIVRKAFDDELMEISSPTFLICNTYKHFGLGLNINHFDLYRLHTIEEMEFLECKKVFSDGISFVEWPKKLAINFITGDNNVVDLKIEDLEEETSRMLTFSTLSKKWEKLFEKI